MKKMKHWECGPWCIFTFFSLCNLQMGPKKLECLYLASPFQSSVIQDSNLLAPFISNDEIEALGIRSLVHIHKIIFVTYKWVQQARVFIPGKPFPVKCNVTLLLIGPIHKLWRKWCVVNEVPVNINKTFFSS